MKRILVIDDDNRTRRILQILIERLGLESIALENGKAALAFLREETVDLILTDLRMPEMDGLTFMRALREFDGDVPVIVLTAYGTVSSAVDAMKLGAIDFVSKPFDVDALEVLIQRALTSSRHRAENLFLREQANRAPDLHEMVGRAPAMQDVFELVRKVAPTRSAVLLTGETGTGKELVARAIHKLSPREDELFVPLNCSAIPAELLESELFGHVKGAFSGALADRVGKFQAADGGTLFLDEIGDMDLRLQAKLLRVLQEGIVEPVGGNRRIRVDVRIVSSTNRDLDASIAEGSFRQDLYYRLNVFRIVLPALRNRKQDIPELADSFLAQFGAELGKKRLALTEEAVRALVAYDWPGNVRELRNVVERAAVLSDDARIDRALVDRCLPRSDSPEPEAESRLAEAVAAVERRTILRALAETGDNKVAAAARLGIGERTLWTKLKKYGL
ncbi:MAG TPA: sigma-54 dependent transcriptional regulator [Myxococcota bacterium]|nr:sigma-54-dependent Fis family transcriptional regulator [Myxococcales bacterium]HPG24037.1 sigma-54 dependent transcriptional regulator [Myxococcota bacterium]